MTRTRRARRPPTPSASAQCAIRDLLTGLGCELTGELRDTPRRAAELWTSYLLDGEGQDPRRILGTGSATRSRGQSIGLRMLGGSSFSSSWVSQRVRVGKTQ